MHRKTPSQAWGEKNQQSEKSESFRKSEIRGEKNKVWGFV